MFKTLITTLAVGVMLTACAGVSSEKVASLQKKDKMLNCKEIMLEQNEAEFYRKTAEKNKGPSIRNVVMPLGYISTFVDAQKAIEAADSRVEYLNRIYDILDCDNPSAEANQRPSTVNATGGFGRGGSAQSAAAYNNETVAYSDDWYW